MALHPLKLPANAKELRCIVSLQKLLLKALCGTPMGSAFINEAWLRHVWPFQDEVWIHKFCRKRGYSVLEPIKALADATLKARSALYNEFCIQSNVASVFSSGGQFNNLDQLPDLSSTLAEEVGRLFVRFYAFLSHDSGINWDGYIFSHGRRIRLDDYKDNFDQANLPELAVCPYCDGANDGPDLDHYYPKDSFPLLSCSPWNLVPACHLCNKIGSKQGNLPMDQGAAEPTLRWLHPYFRPASPNVVISLSGPPSASIPRLHSSDSGEIAMLDNHALLIPTLSKRWTRAAKNHYDNLVSEVEEKLKSKPGETIDSLVDERRRDSIRMRGREAYSMVRAAVCEAVLARRHEYLEEFNDSNSLRLV